MNYRNNEIPEYVKFQTQIEKENKIIQTLIKIRAQTHEMNISQHYMRYGLKYEILQI